MLNEDDSSESGAIRLSHSLDENAIESLVKCGLQDRFPEEYNTWVRRLAESRNQQDVKIRKGETAVKEKLTSESAQLEGILREAIVDAVMTTFPCVFRAVDLAHRLMSSSRTLNRESLGDPPSVDDVTRHDVTKPAGARNFDCLGTKICSHTPIRTIIKHNCAISED